MGKRNDNVSVPYKGYLFFNASSFTEKAEMKETFPSLTGVIRFLMMCVSKYLDIVFKDEFPSLTGVIRFLILPSKTRMITWLKMSFAGQNYF